MDPKEKSTLDEIEDELDELAEGFEKYFDDF